MDIARHVTLSQVRHSLTILGRKMGESIPLAYLIYPLYKWQMSSLSRPIYHMEELTNDVHIS